MGLSKRDTGADAAAAPPSSFEAIKEGGSAGGSQKAGSTGGSQKAGSTGGSQKGSQKDVQKAGGVAAAAEPPVPDSMQVLLLLYCSRA